MTRHSAVWLGFVGAALVATAPAQAAAPHHARVKTASRTGQTAPAAADSGVETRCLLISRLLMRSSDQSRQAMGAAGSLYFAARLQRRMSDSQIEDALVADAQKPAPAPDQTKACGDLLDARLRELDGVSQRVDARLDIISPRQGASPPAASSPAPLPDLPLPSPGATPPAAAPPTVTPHPAAPH